MENSIKKLLKKGDLGVLRRETGFSYSTIRNWVDRPHLLSGNTAFLINSRFLAMRLERESISEEIDKIKNEFLTREEAEISLRNGKAVRQSIWPKGHFIKLEGDQLIDHNGNAIKGDIKLTFSPNILWTEIKETP